MTVLPSVGLLPSGKKTKARDSAYADALANSEQQAAEEIDARATWMASSDERI